MIVEDRLEALELIENRQRDCASVEVSIGGTKQNNQVEHDTLYLTKCPACIINTLRDHGFSLSVDEGGVRVEKYG